MPRSIHHSTIKPNFEKKSYYGSHIFRDYRKKQSVSVPLARDAKHFYELCKDWYESVTAECPDQIQLKDYSFARDMYVEACIGKKLGNRHTKRVSTMKALFMLTDSKPRSVIIFKHFIVEDFIKEEFRRNRLFLMNVQFLTAIYQSFIRGYFCHFCKIYNKNWPKRYNVCGDCRVAYYCSTRCQESHYKSSHKKVCSKYYKL